MEDQSRAWHQIQHASDDRPVESRRRHLAIRWEAPLVLRPKSVHHKRKRASAALAVWRPIRPANLRRLAIGRRPGQSENVIVEPAGFALATFLSESPHPRNNRHAAGDGSEASPPAQTMTHSMALLT